MMMKHHQLVTEPLQEVNGSSYTEITIYSKQEEKEKENNLQMIKCSQIVSE